MVGFIRKRRWEIHLSRKGITHNCKREISRQNKIDISRKQYGNNRRGASTVGVSYWK